MEVPEKHLDAGDKNEKDICQQILQTEKKANLFLEWNILKCQIKINKHLLSLKLVFIFTFTAASSILSFLPVFLRQRGVTLSELTIILNVAYSLQAIFSPICGIIVDKLGHLKLLITVTIAASAVFALALIFLPSAQNFEEDFCYLNTTNFSLVTAKHGPTLENMSSNCSLYKNFNETCFVNKSSEQYYSEEDVIKHLHSADMYDLNKLNFSWPDNRTSANQIHCLLCSFQANKEQQILCKINGDDTLSSRGTYKIRLAVVYGVFVCAHSVFLEKTLRLVDVIALNVVSEHNSDYGRQKFWSNFGYLAGPFLSGFVAKYFSGTGYEKNYNYSIYLFMVQSFISIIAVAFLSLPDHKPAKKMWKKAILLFKNIDIFFVTIILLVLGATYGFRISFKNWYLEDIGANSYFIGVNDGLFGLYSMPFLLSSKIIISKMGKNNIFLLALLGSALNSFGYALLKVPWPAMLLELTWGITFHLFWAAIIEFCQDVAPSDLLATVCIVAGCLHFSLGKVAGSSIGGFFMNNYGGRISYEIMGVVHTCCFIIYGCYLLKFRRNNRKMNT